MTVHRVPILASVLLAGIVFLGCGGNTPRSNTRSEDITFEAGDRVLLVIDSTFETTGYGTATITMADASPVSLTTIEIPTVKTFSFTYPGELRLVSAPLSAAQANTINHLSSDSAISVKLATRLTKGAFRTDENSDVAAELGQWKDGSNKFTVKMIHDINIEVRINKS